MKKIVTVCCFLLCLCFGNGQTQHQKRIENYLESVYQNHTIPGFAAVVVKDKEVLYRSGFGKKYFGNDEAFTPNTLSDIGSLTKSITAMAIMQLVETKKVSLDKPVVDYLPDFGTANKTVSDKITVRMLLNNTAGLQSNPVASYHPSTKALEHLSNDLKTTFLSKEPGSSYEYSNTDFSIAGLLIQHITGMSYEEYVTAHIFKPLGMNSSISNAILNENPSSLKGHHFGLRPIPAKKSDFKKSGEFVPAGSATTSTVSDLGNYLIALLNGGNYKGHQVLSNKSIDELWSPNIDFQGLSEADGGNGKKYHYGLGWMISEIDGRRIIHHGGSTGTMSSFTMIDPKNKTATSLLFNMDLTFIDTHTYLPHYTIANNILHLANGEKTTRFGIPVEEDGTLNDFKLEMDQKESYVGQYQYESGGLNWIDFGLSLDIELTEEKGLKGTASRGNQVVGEFILDFLNPATSVTRNIAQPETIYFTFSGNGVIKGVVWNGRRYKKQGPKQANLKTYVLNNTIELDLPKSWSFDKTCSGFVALHKNEDAKITAWINSGPGCENKVDATSYISNIPSKKIGLKTIQNFSVQRWEAQSFEASNGKIYTHYYTVGTKTPIQLVLESGADKQTKNIKEAMEPLLSSLSSNGNAIRMFQ